MAALDAGEWRRHLLESARLHVTDEVLGRGSFGEVRRALLDGTTLVCAKVRAVFGLRTRLTRLLCGPCTCPPLGPSGARASGCLTMHGLQARSFIGSSVDHMRARGAGIHPLLLFDFLRVWWGYLPSLVHLPPPLICSSCHPRACTRWRSLSCTVLTTAQRVWLRCWRPRTARCATWPRCGKG